MRFGVFLAPFVQQLYSNFEESISAQQVTEIQAVERSIAISPQPRPQWNEDGCIAPGRS